MNDYLKEAIAIAQAQASVRVMNEEEIILFIQNVANNLKSIAESDEKEPDMPTAEMIAQARKSIKEKEVICLECGKTMKVITDRHLRQHGMDAAQYKKKWGIHKRVPLTCKYLVRERSTRMQAMQLWEKRHSRQEMEEHDDSQSA
ncbi:MAG: MucR family transcriptional regulator [Desulfovibrio sp.]|nr:MucR family transcriptional regulator [Desulfovibrio sp.]